MIFLHLNVEFQERNFNDQDDYDVHTKYFKYANNHRE